MREKVQQAIDEIRPWLQADGGNVELIDVNDEGLVTVKLTGACHGCPMAQMTLHMGIRNQIMKRVPEVKEVQAIE